MARSLGSPRHEAIAALLARERKKAKLRQVDLAKRLKRRQDYVSYVETGQKVVDLVEFLDWAEAIGFDVAEAIKAIRRTRAR